jgi:hypothetical protein
LTLIPPQNVKNLAKTNKTAKNIYNSMFYMLLLVGMLVALINGLITFRAAGALLAG